MEFLLVIASPDCRAFAHWSAPITYSPRRELSDFSKAGRWSHYGFLHLLNQNPRQAVIAVAWWFTAQAISFFLTISRAVGGISAYNGIPSRGDHADNLGVVIICDHAPTERFAQVSLQPTRKRLVTSRKVIR